MMRWVDVGTISRTFKHLLGVTIIVLFACGGVIQAEEWPEYMIQRKTIVQEVKTVHSRKKVIKLLGEPDEIIQPGKRGKFKVAYAYGVREPGTFAFGGIIHFGRLGFVKGFADRFEYASNKDPFRIAEEYDEIRMRAANGLQAVIQHAEIELSSTGSHVSVDLEIRNLGNHDVILKRLTPVLWSGIEVELYDGSGFIMKSVNTAVWSSFMIHAGSSKRYTWTVPSEGKIHIPVGLKLEEPLPSGTYFVRVWFDLYGPDSEAPMFPSNLFELTIPESE